jgi:glycosyltransferase involved in cell wall biosynthesis
VAEIDGGGKNAQKVTIAHFMPWSGIGGVEIATVRMTAALSNQYRHVAFCLADAHELRRMFEHQGVETITVEAPEPSIRHGLGFYRQSRKVAEKLKACGADVVHFSDEKAAYHNSLAGTLARLPMICHLRVSYPVLSMRQRLCLGPVDSFIFVSEEAKQTFAMRVPERKKRVVYDSVEVPAEERSEEVDRVRQELGISRETPLVGTVARVSPQKDYFTLAAAAVEVLRQHPEARFLVVGDNSKVELNRQHYGKVTARLKELGIEDKFIFTGHSDHVPKLISAMNFCVLSTHREGFPLSILESMALGKAVVATAVGGIPEIVKDGITGYLHQHEDSSGLATEILRLLDDESETKKLGLNAKEYVRQNFNREKYTREMANAYANVMGY